ncbi:hypothetical protein NIES4071_73150 [Calothrix sp. NIES-4071]|nr:hypothetical protein NIES4071_73150 [Calothrix sp. NIES-4071]BAZ61590.1 hypothetical protein NIES4105_73100 [Calothrix sp. NIES-4105]
MTTTIPAETITLEQLRDLFELELIENDIFFTEWQGNLPELTEQDKEQQPTLACPQSTIYYPDS